MVKRILNACPNCRRQYDVSAVAAESVSCTCGRIFQIERPDPRHAAQMHCHVCGKRVAMDDVACVFCGDLVTLDELHEDALCPECFARLPEKCSFCGDCGVRIDPQPVGPPLPDRDCPRCRHALRRRVVDGHPLVECGACGGLWLNHKVFEALCNEAENDESPWDGHHEDDGQPHPDHAPGYLDCPDCGDLMNPRNFGGSSQIIVDFCQAHGVWLDRDDLHRVLDWLHGEARSDEPIGGIGKHQRGRR
ncbi:MAG TPA: zf-TFIIB domain-containing protein [Planctomycetota bacterium]